MGGTSFEGVVLQAYIWVNFPWGLEVNGDQFYFVFPSPPPGPIECIHNSKEIFQN